MTKCRMCDDPIEGEGAWVTLEFKVWEENKVTDEAALWQMSPSCDKCAKKLKNYYHRMFDPAEQERVREHEDELNAELEREREKGWNR